MSTVNVYGNVSWSYKSNFLDSGFYITIPDDSPLKNQKLLLNSVTLYCVKFTNNNPSYPIKLQSGGTVSAGQTTSNGTVTLKLKVNNQLSNETHTITGKKNLRNAEGSVPSSGYYDYINSFATATDSYTFTFGDSGVAISEDTRIYLIVTGTQSNYTNGLSIRQGSNNLRGLADISAIPQGPTTISVTPVSGNDNWITDLSGVTKNGIDILKDYQTQFNLIPNPSSAKITSATFSGNNNTNCSYSNGIITVTAKTNNINYPIKDTITVTVNGGASTSFDVNFYEKINVNRVGNNNIDLNVRNAAYGNRGVITFSDYNPITNAAKGRKLFIDDIGYSSFTVKNNTTLDIGARTYISYANNNIFKIENENVWHKLKLRFYNTSVQIADSDKGTYKKDIIVNARWSYTPNMISQFGFSWLDSNNNILQENEIPNIVLVEQETPMIGNLFYTNLATTGGFCRGFHVDFYNDNGQNVYNKDLTVNYNTGTGLVSTTGRLIDKNEFSSLPYDTFLTVKITMYFYFDKDSTKHYNGATYTVEQKFIRISDSTLLPSLIFPSPLNQSNPSTGIYMKDIERFGYSFNNITLNNQIKQNIQDFGVILGNIYDNTISIENKNKVIDNINLLENNIIINNLPTLNDTYDVYCKNLFYIDDSLLASPSTVTINDYGRDIHVSSYSTVVITGNILPQVFGNILPGATVTTSVDVKKNKLYSNATGRIIFLSKNSSVTSLILLNFNDYADGGNYGVDGEYHHMKNTITIPEDFDFNNYYGLYFYGDADFKSLQIEIGSKETNYVYGFPYFSIVNNNLSSLSFNLPITKKISPQNIITGIVINSLNNNYPFNVNSSVIENNAILSINSDSSYFSSNIITDNIVCNMGKAISDNNLLNIIDLSILPYIILFDENISYSKMIIDTINNIAYLDTTVLWDRPSIEEGSIILSNNLSQERDKYNKFITKYNYLTSNEIADLIKKGEIISTDYWTDITIKLVTYALNMQNWSTDVTNFSVLWALPEFTHKKGEIINYYNLLQNYYDLLIQYDNQSFSTYEYLNNQNYTHDFLSNFTHDNITNKEGM